MVTARGIYYDLNETIYYYRVGSYKFYFSSKKYRDKFIKIHEDFEKQEALKFYQRYNIEIKDTTIFSLMLYSIIEKRGFLVEKTDVKEKIYELPKIKIIVWSDK